MLKYYKYPLKVWLTTAPLGTLALFLCSLVGILIEKGVQVENIRNLTSDDYCFMCVMVVISLVCSFPYFIMLWIVYSRLMKDQVNDKMIKIALSVFGAFVGSICLLSVYYFYLNELKLKSVLELLLPYNVVLISSIWYFKLKSKLEVANGL